MTNESLDNIINKALIDYCKYYGLTFIPTLDYCPILNVQAKDFIDKQGLFEPGGYCLAWSIWYIDLRLKYPEMNRKELINQAMDTITSVGFRNYIRKYSSYIISFRHKIQEFPDKYLTPVEGINNDTYYIIKNNGNYEMWKHLENNKFVTTHDKIIQYSSSDITKLVSRNAILQLNLTNISARITVFFKLYSQNEALYKLSGNIADVVTKNPELKKVLAEYLESHPSDTIKTQF